MLEADVFEERGASENSPFMAQAFGLMFAALDDLKPNEVYICAGGSPRYAVWGELMSVRAISWGRPAPSSMATCAIPQAYWRWISPLSPTFIRAGSRPARQSDRLSRAY